MAEERKQKVDYTQVRVLGDADAEKTKRMCEELEQLMSRVRREYELWFYGTHPKPPYELRNSLDNHVRMLRRKVPKRTADAWQIGVLLQKYQTLAELWDKSVRKQEEGGKALWMAEGHRSVLDELQEANERRQEEAKAAERPASSNYLAKVRSPEGDVEEIRKVFNSYVAAKKKVGDDVSGADFEKFRNTIGKQTRTLIESGKAKAVSYRVEIQDGKVAIKAKAESDG